MALQEAALSFAAIIPESSTDSMFMTLRQAISVHSPAIIAPAAKPLVLAGPFGAACRKGELLQWLLREYGSKVAAPDMFTTKPRTEGADASSPFKVHCLCPSNWLQKGCKGHQNAALQHNMSRRHSLVA